MKSLLTFEQFVNEAIVVDDFKKVCITRRKDLDDSFITGDNYRTPEYWVIMTKDMDPIEYPKGTPVLNYDRKTLEKFMEAGAIQENQIYNHPEARKSISSKSFV